VSQDRGAQERTDRRAVSVAGAAALIEARDVVKSFGPTPALRGASLAVRAGEIVAVMGPSGSGKSTLLHCLAGLDTLTSGHVYLGDIDLSTLSDKEVTRIRRDRVGFVFQTFNLLPTLTAIENITLPLALAGHKPDQAWLDRIIDTVSLRDRLEHRPSELSGGQQQRVAVARALVTKPEIIFADEPTGNLDSRSSAEILGFLQRAVEEFGQTIVMVTHDPISASYSNRVVFLADGHIVDELLDPTADAVLGKMRNLGGE
jgi:putative ABC transport system ATP-binding protein